MNPEPDTREFYGRAPERSPTPRGPHAGLQIFWSRWMNVWFVLAAERALIEFDLFLALDVA